jgi:hypothetical protein
MRDSTSKSALLVTTSAMRSLIGMKTSVIQSRQAAASSSVGAGGEAQ